MRTSDFAGYALGCFAAAAVLAGCGSLPSGSARTVQQSLARHATGNAKISHIVIIIQENRSFENLFAGFPGANAPMYGYTFRGHRRVKVPLHETTFETNTNLPHTWEAAMAGWDKGKMDGFHGPRNNDSAYTYLDRRQIRPYWAMAEQYVLADEMFPSEFGGSYATHMMAVAGNDDITDTEALVNEPTHPPNDCDSPPGTRSSLVSIARQVGRGNGPFPCFSQFNTMAEVLDNAGISWKYYILRHLNGGLYSPFEAIAYVRYGPDWNADVIAPETRVLTDIKKDRLADVTWVTPKRSNSDISGERSDTGPSWVSAIVNEIGESRYWDSTAIFVTWDEWGGWFDNASPPQLDFRGLGIRVPCLIISPYAKHGYVSHVQYEFGSFLRFIESVYGLPAGSVGPISHGYTDGRAAGFDDAFDFTQQPRKFHRIHAKYPISHFLYEPPSSEPVDTE